MIFHYYNAFLSKYMFERLEKNILETDLTIVSIIKKIFALKCCWKLNNGLKAMYL